MPTLYVARHTETNYNDEGRYLGSSDPPLNDRGLAHAKVLIRALIEKVDHAKVVSSPYQRCLFIAQEISRALGTTPIIMSDFRERSVGVFEGLTRPGVAAKYPELWAKNVTHFYTEAPPGGENIHEVQERVSKGLAQLKTKFPSDNVVLVTHAFIGRLIHKYFNQSITDEEFFKYNLRLGEIAQYIWK